MSKLPAPSLTWDADMPLLNNRFFLYDLGKLLFWTGLICGLIFGIIAVSTGGWKSLAPMMAVFGLIMFGFLFLFVLIALVFFGNTYPQRYLITSRGVAWESLSRRGKAASRLAVAAGALSGSASTAGAGLLAATSESGLLPWKEVRKIKAYPALGVISVMNSWRVVNRLYCTPEHYAAAMEWLRRGAPSAQFLESGPLVEAAPEAASRASLGLELARRLALVSGVFTFLWLAWWTPPVIVKVERADFEKEFEHRYGSGRRFSFGAMGMAGEFLRRNTNPGSLEAYVRRTTENFVIDAPGEQWAEMYRRVARQPAWFHADDAALAAILPRIREIRGRGNMCSYLPVPSEGRTAWLLVWYDDRPRDTGAGSSLIYPRRAASWYWLLGGLLGYFLLPWPKQRRTSLTGDRAMIMIVDLLGLLFAAFFFALPLYLAHFTGEVLGDELGLTLFLWCVSWIGLGMLAWSARLAAHRS